MPMFNIFQCQTAHCWRVDSLLLLARHREKRSARPQISVARWKIDCSLRLDRMLFLASRCRGGAIFERYLHCLRETNSRFISSSASRSIEVFLPLFSCFVGEGRIFIKISQSSCSDRQRRWQVKSLVSRHCYRLNCARQLKRSFNSIWPRTEEKETFDGRWSEDFLSFSFFPLAMTKTRSDCLMTMRRKWEQKISFLFLFWIE